MQENQQDKVVEYLRRVTADLRRSRQQVRALEMKEHEPIAIVGMACRYPGGVGSPEDLWRLVNQGRDVIAPFPTDRGWDLENLYDPDPDHTGTSYTREGGFLYEAAEFDAGFFGISPREAQAMDPQQRLLLEVAWETVERTGIAPGSLRDSNTGVYIGATAQEYGPRVQAAPDDVEGTLLTGSTLSIMSGRIAYQLGLVGPAVTIDTACSSSTVALHLAVRALRSGECSMALAGGVAIMSTPSGFIEFSRQRGLSADGRCKAFAAAADGTGWGEGVGMLLVERLSDARRLGHEVWAVVRGSAVNQDGASNGLTAPNGPSQQRVIQAALANARLTAADVDAVEAHGTGTKLGDPIEAEALHAVYGKGHGPEAPLYLGSVKSNIGHTQAAAGVAGVIKMVMAMRAGVLPATLHVDEPTPHVDWSSGAVELLTQQKAWTTQEGRPRRAGVSAFGISGTNAHVIIEQPEPAEDTEEAAADQPVRSDDHPVGWVVSGRGDAGLRGQAARLADFAESADELDIVAVAGSLATSRAALSDRAVVVGTSRDELVTALRALEEDRPAPGLVRGSVPGSGVGPVGVVFAGQGSQRPGMGRGLYEAFPVFAEAFDAACAAVDAAWEVAAPGAVRVPLRETVFSGDTLSAVDIAQCALFAVETAQFRLLESMGLVVAAVAGHSLGEITAAHVAGMLSLQDAALLVVSRAQAMVSLPAGGAMTALQATPREVTEAIEATADPHLVGIAAVNAPQATVVSGVAKHVDAVADHFRGQGRRVRPLHVERAYHSVLMEPALEDFTHRISGLVFHPPRIPLVSAVTGQVAAAETQTPDYWAKHIRQPVLFADTTHTLTTLGITTLLELGPDAVLTPLIEQTAPDAVHTIPFQRADQPHLHTALTALAHLWTTGTPIPWDKTHPTPQRPHPDLPTYAFQHKRHWLDAPENTKDGRSATPEALPAVRAAEEQADGGTSRLAGLAGQARDRAVAELVRGEVASVLGYEDADEIDPEQAFNELGLTSITAVDLRGRLQAATGLRLPATLAFDYPTPRAVIGHITDTLAETPLAAPPATVTAKAAVTDDDPVVIVGLACRYPGGATSPEEFWRIAAEGADAVGPFPADRGWDLESLYDADPARSGTSYARHGGFLYDAAEFDAGFFGISPREALAMDPQQRLLLETAWETFERAGIDPKSLHGSRTGVFVGASWQAYGPELRLAPEQVEGHLLTGNAPSVMSGRLAYQFGLVGPALTVDTACSSSLVALHLAVQALRSGECMMALAGGVTVMSTPGPYIEFSRQRGLSVDGRCRAFAASANGTGFSEGIGLLLVERLSDARRLGHEVWAVVRGSAVNQDGASNGLTAPNGPSQQRVLQAALAGAGLEAADVDAVEAHGTGTKLGDPIEAEALHAVYGKGHGPEAPLYLGSVKSNIGHSQHAAGVAGVIKMVMAMRAGVLPATLHVDEPTPHVDWSSGAIELLTDSRPWGTPRGRPRRAGVSAFGFSGTNAHVIIEQPEPAEDTEEAAADQPVRSDDHPVGWVVSGRGDAGLRGQAARLADFAESADELDIVAVAGSLATSRAALSDRAVVVGTSRDELVTALRALEEDRPAPGLVRGSVGAGGLGSLVWVFPGQGAQWAGMGRELLEQSPVFAASITKTAQALARFVDWDLEEVLRGTADEVTLSRVDVIQPASFAVMTGLAAVWQSLGCLPDAVVGHSQGEIAAAHAAGILSLDDAVRVVALRSQLIAKRLAGGGAMISLSTTREHATTLIGRHTDVSVAVENSPGSTVIAGNPTVLESIATTAETEGIRVRRIAVDYASHSPQVEILEEELARTLEGIQPGPSHFPMLSTVTGQWLSGPEATATYWYENLRHPVRFSDAVTRLLDEHHQIFIEVSSHPVLVPAIEDTAGTTGTPVTALGSLRRDHGSLTPLLTNAATLWTQGHPTTPTPASLTPAMPQGDTSAVMALPTYAFQRERFWLTPTAPSGDLSSVGLNPSDHPLLGATIDLPDNGILLTARLTPTSTEWLGDYVVGGSALLPGSVLVDLAVQAGDRVGCSGLLDLGLTAPLTLPQSAHGALHLRVAVGAADESGARSIAVHTRPESSGAEEGGWTEHAIGQLGLGLLSPPDGVAGSGVEGWTQNGSVPAGAVPVDVDALYGRLADAGHDEGPAFQRLRKVFRLGEQFLAEVVLDPAWSAEAETFTVHPTLLEAALHPLLPAADGELVLPLSWHGVQVHATGAHTLRVSLTPAGPDSWSLHATDRNGLPVITAERVTLGTVDRAALRPSADVTQHLYEVRWVAAPTAAAPTPVGPVAVLGADSYDDLDAAAPRYPGLTTLLTALDTGDEPPAYVVASLAPGGAEQPTALHTATEQALGLLQDFLVSGKLADTRLLVVTRHGVVAGPDDGGRINLASAAVWGLVRSAQTENPDRITLLDLDDHPLTTDALSTVLATAEPQLALREGDLLAPRLTVAATQAAPDAPAWDTEGTVLITGGTGLLGSLAARHLVTHHGIRHLHLVSRQGTHAPASTELAEELTALGAQITISACDVADPTALQALIASVPTHHPLRAIIHTAGVLDDGITTSLTPQKLATVLGPKADAAWHLHQLTQDIDLTHFIMYSSVSGLLGGAGQANYAAANTFLDALAHHRHAQDLPATSLAWGLWEQAGSMTGHLADTDLQRMNRMGARPLSFEDGIRLFDAATGTGRPAVAPIGLNRAALRARRASLPPLFHDLAGGPGRAVAATAAVGDADGHFGLAQQLSGLGAAERDRALVAFVRVHTADTLGYPDDAQVSPARAFKELGFDSLTAVELRNRLNALTGLRLPTTLVFDHPTPEALARYLRDQLFPVEEGAAEAGESEEDARIRRILATIPISRLHRTGVLDLILEIADVDLNAESPGSTAGASAVVGGAAGGLESIDDMDEESLLRLATESR